MVELDLIKSKTILAFIIIKLNYCQFDDEIIKIIVTLKIIIVIVLVIVCI